MKLFINWLWTSLELVQYQFWTGLELVFSWGICWGNFTVNLGYFSSFWGNFALSIWQHCLAPNFLNRTIEETKTKENSWQNWRVRRLKTKNWEFCKYFETSTPYSASRFNLILNIFIATRMWLESVILTGFRSFRDRSEVHFDKGHTAVIGRYVIRKSWVFRSTFNVKNYRCYFYWAI